MAGIKALAWAARRRGTSYGNLVAQLTPETEREIERQYKAYREAESRRARERAAELATKRRKERAAKKKPTH